VISDPKVIEVLHTTLRKHVADLEMTADTQQMVGEHRCVRRTLKEWARARAALNIIEKGMS
jgi:hypothetical protein